MTKSQRRRMKHGISAHVYQKRRKRLIDLSDRTCGYCGIKIVRNRDITIDHILPLSRGGKSGYDNMIVACKRCNDRKRDSCDLAIISFLSYYTNLTSLKFYIVTLKVLANKG